MRLKPVASVVIGIVVIAPFAAWMGVRRHEVSQRNQCMENLRQLSAPLACCVPREQNLSKGAALDPKQIAQYLKGGTIPKCPSGAEYDVVWKVGARYPRCPYHGALLGTNEMGSDVESGSAGHGGESR